LLRLPAGILGGVEIVVKQETGKPRLHRKAEQPEPQIVTNKMQTVSYFHECLVKNECLVKSDGWYESRVADSPFDARLP
jgi:putative SOS response-associated peptidase YedK